MNSFSLALLAYIAKRVFIFTFFLFFFDKFVIVAAGATGAMFSRAIAFTSFRLRSNNKKKTVFERAKSQFRLVRETK